MFVIIICLIVVGSLVVNLFVGGNLELQNSDLLANSIILPTAFFIFLLLLSKKQKENGIKDFSLLLAVSFVIRIGFMYWDRYYRHIFTFPNSGLDTGSFDWWARDFIANEMSGYSGYSAVLGWIYTFYYPNPLWGQFINVVVSIIGILVIYEIICLLKIDPKYKFYGVLLICFLPNYLIMSSILLRESFITTLLAISIYYLLKWWIQGNWFNLIFSIASVLAATYLHSGVIAYAVAIYIIVAFGGNKQRKFKVKLSTVLTSVIAIMLFMFIYNNYGDVFFGYMDGVESAEDVIAKSANYSTGGASYTVSIVSDDSILGLIVNSPIRMFYFLASPLPWDWRGINDIIAFIGNGLFYMVSLYCGFRAIRNSDFENKNIIIVFLIIALASAFLYSWGVSNAGTALRHRDKFIANFTLILIISLDAMRKTKRKVMINQVDGEYDDKKNLLFYR